MQKKLTKLRKKIDAADRAWIQAFSKRFKAVAKVGALKREHGLPVHQKARWKEVVTARLKLARAKGVDERFVKAILDLIHDEAIRIQTPRKARRK